jgi:PIN domain nuclease of toxin-antitoxin system
VIVVDTHALVWWRTGDRRLSQRANRSILRAVTVYVPDIANLEIAVLAHTGRIRLPEPTATWLAQLLAEPSLAVVAITPEIANAAAALQQSLRDPVDSLVAATAMRMHLPLVTKDERLRAAGIETIW